MMHEIIFGERSYLGMSNVQIPLYKRLQSSLIEQAVLYLKVEATCKAHWQIVDCDMIARSSLALLECTPSQTTGSREQRVLA
jgi:hypothetical protein